MWVMSDLESLRAYLAQQDDVALAYLFGSRVSEHVVVAHGNRLFERDVATRVEFEAGVMSRYADFVYTLREQRADLIRGGRYETGVRRNRAALRQTEGGAHETARPGYGRAAVLIDSQT